MWCRCLCPRRLHMHLPSKSSTAAPAWAACSCARATAPCCARCPRCAASCCHAPRMCRLTRAPRALTWLASMRSAGRWMTWRLSWQLFGSCRWRRPARATHVSRDAPIRLQPLLAAQVDTAAPRPLPSGTALQHCGALAALLRFLFHPTAVTPPLPPRHLSPPSNLYIPKLHSCYSSQKTACLPACPSVQEAPFIAHPCMHHSPQRPCACPWHLRNP